MKRTYTNDSSPWKRARRGLQAAGYATRSKTTRPARLVRRAGGIAGRGFYGRGDYSSYGTVNNQLLTGSDNMRNALRSSSTKGNTGDIYFEHREFVQNITVVPNTVPVAGVYPAGITVFSCRDLPINVGLNETFPFLSQLAVNFTMYELMGCCFEYRPLSGEGGNDNALGKVILATNYDPSAGKYSNAREMENADWSVSAKPSLSINHFVETHPTQTATKMLYVRTTDAATQRDKIFTDYGLFQLATEGVPFAQTTSTSIVIGELWVTYKCKLSRSRIYQAIGDADFADAFVMSTMNSLTTGSGGFNNVGLGTQVTNWGAPMVYTASVGNTITYPSHASLYSVDYNPPISINNAAGKITNSIGGAVIATGNTGFDYRFPSGVTAGTYLIQLKFSTSLNVTAGTMIPAATTTRAITNIVGSLGDIQLTVVNGVGYASRLATHVISATSGWSSKRESGAGITGLVSRTSAVGDMLFQYYKEYVVQVIAPGSLLQCICSFGVNDTYLPMTQGSLNVVVSQVPDNFPI